MAKIVIIDSSPFMRGSLKFLLERAGHEVAGNTDNIREAEELYRKFRPDIVTLDITMGGTEGISILKSILSINPSAKVVMISSAGNEDKKEEAQNIGVYGYIEKPYKYEQVESGIEKAIKSSKKL